MTTSKKTAAYEALSPQSPNIRWRIEIPGSLAHHFWIDHDEERLLVSDGWGIAYASLRLRAFSLDSGREVTSARFGNLIRALARSPSGNCFAMTDTKLFRLDRSTLVQIEKWDSRIPRYTNELLVGETFAYACNSGPTLHIVHIPTMAIKRRKLDTEMQIHPWDEQRFVIASGIGRIWIGDFDKDTIPRQIASTSRFCDTAMDEKGKLWLSFGKRSERSGSAVNAARPTPYLGCLDLHNPSEPNEIDLGHPFWQVFVSQNGQTISIIATSTEITEDGPRWRQTDAISFQTQSFRCTSWLRVPDGFEVQLISPEKGIGLATQPLDRPRGDPPMAELICFDL